MFSNSFLPPGKVFERPCIWKMYCAAIGAPVGAVLGVRASGGDSYPGRRRQCPSPEPLTRRESISGQDQASRADPGECAEACDHANERRITVLPGPRLAPG